MSIIRNFTSSIIGNLTSSLSGGGGLVLPIINSSLALHQAGSYLNLPEADIVTVDGSNRVSNWKGQNGTFDATEDTEGLQPLFGQTLINGLPTFDYYGVDNQLTFGSNFLFSTGTGITIYAVVKAPTAATGNNNFIFDFGRFTLSGYGLSYSDTVVQIYAIGAGSLENHSNGNNAVILTFRLTFGDKMELFFNGSSTAHMSNNITLTQLTAAEINESATRDPSAGPVTIGRQSKTNLDVGRAFQGQIAEMAAYAESHSDQQMLTTANYFSQKYAIPLIA